MKWIVEYLNQNKDSIVCIRRKRDLMWVYFAKEQPEIVFGPFNTFSDCVFDERKRLA